MGEFQGFEWQDPEDLEARTQDEIQYKQWVDFKTESPELAERIRQRVDDGQDLPLQYYEGFFQGTLQLFKILTGPLTGSSKFDLRSVGFVSANLFGAYSAYRLDQKDGQEWTKIQSENPKQAKGLENAADGGNKKSDDFYRGLNRIANEVKETILKSPYVTERMIRFQTYCVYKMVELIGES